MNNFEEFLEEQINPKPNLKKLSDAAKQATANYGKKANDSNLEKAHQAHKEAYEAHLAQHRIKDLGNSTYNRMKEHGKDVDHYKQLLKTPHKS